MNSVNKTLYIPLRGKALLSSQGRVIHDPWAEEIWNAEGFPLRGKAASKWLAYHMAIRSAGFDRWTAEKLAENPNATVLHLGCGLDSRCHRVTAPRKLWFDVDFPDVMDTRGRYFAQQEGYRMLGSDLRENWLSQVPRGGCAIVVMEGISMYLNREELKALLAGIRSHFDKVHLLMDIYTPFGAAASKYKNPINQVGVTKVYGYENPETLFSGLTYLTEHPLCPEELIAQLPKKEQGIFRHLFAGGFARRIYRLWEFEG